MEDNIIPSPCISYCKKNNDGICEGCYRTIDEIYVWFELSSDEKKQVWKNCEERIEQLPDSMREFVKKRNKDWRGILEG